jgi:uncharacterized damage-inducible protein DinB
MPVEPSRGKDIVPILPAIPSNPRLSTGQSITQTAVTTAAALRSEFDRETRSTRKYLERLADDHLAWRPHRKSFTAGELAAHIVECVRWTDAIFSGDEFNFDPATFTPYQAQSSMELLQTFDADVARGTRVLANADDDAAARPWLMRMKGTVRFERSKAEVFRDFTLSHLIHHRGQLSVYLRLLEISVPGAYGPTADE